MHATTAAPHRFVLRDNNVWALPLAADAGGEEGGWLLIDAGLAYEGDDAVSSWEILVAQARAAGVEPGAVRTVVVTHEHIDHAGLAAHWAAEGARVVAGRTGIPTLALGLEAYERQREPRLAELRRHGAPERFIETWRASRRPRALLWPPCPPSAIDAAEERPRFALAGGLTLRLIPAPGHTPGNLVALIEETGELFSGDTVLPTTIPTPGLHFPGAVEGDPGAPRWPSLPPFLRSVAAIRELGVVRVFPGHGEVIEAPEVYLDRFEAHHARRAAQVRTVLAEGDATAFAIARGLFRRLPDERLFQAMTEVLGHLDVLEEAGAAERVPRSACRP